MSEVPPHSRTSELALSARAKELFFAALELPASDRETFVAHADESDSVRERARALLAAHTALETAAAEAFAPGVEIGRYRLVLRLGEGGFGEVWRARQLAPLARDVAVKVLKAGVDSRDVLARFALEREALARMQHPAIAAVYDAGATPRGRPWIALELVDGAPLTEYVRTRALPLDARVRLLAEVARAVQHAHARGVLHRDLKPHNVLVAELDGRAQPKVIDFGIAKALGECAAAGEFATRAGTLVGTPAYMSPEQLAGASDIDAQSDVWALGALLYELVSGEPPWPARGASPAELERQRRARDRLPERPSVRARKLGRASDANAARDELDWVALRALEPERSRRYASAGEFAHDLERQLAGLGVDAGPPSLRRRGLRFVRRHRVFALASAVVLVALAAAAIVSGIQAREARHAEREAVLARAAAEAELVRYAEVSRFVEGLFAGLDPLVAQGRDPGVLHDMLTRARSDLTDGRARDPVVEASLRRIVGLALGSLGQLGDAERELARALALRTEARGPEHAETLVSLGEHANVLLRLERAAEAEAEFARELAVRSAQAGGGGFAALAARAGRGMALVELGRAAEAEPLLAEVARERERVLGAGHADSVRALNNHAMALARLGREEEARVEWQRALELQLAERGAEHPETLAALHNFASHLLNRGDAATAEPLLARAVAAKQRVLPAGHPSRIASEGDHAQALAELGRDDEARAAFAAAIAELGGRFDTPQALTLAYNQASWLARRGENEAAALALEQLAAHTRTKSPRHALAWQSESLHGEVLQKLGRAAEALAIARACAEAADGTFARDDIARAVFRYRLGKVLRAHGDEAEARAAFEDALRVATELGDATWQAHVRKALAAGV